MELGIDYNLYMSENGPVVFSPSPFSLQTQLQLPQASMTLPYGTYRSEAIEFMRNFKSAVSTIISHSPIPFADTPLEGELDEFGMHVYAHSFYSPQSQLLDYRYDSDLPDP